MIHLAILGTRGIPNHYGGFEQFAEYLSLGMEKRGHKVTVYNSHTHPYQAPEWNGVEIVHCYDPEDKIGTSGQFIYDLNCIRDIRKRKFDIILQLGYTSSSVWGWWLPRKKSIVTTNMDGLEWKRTKYSARVRRFLQYAEKLGVKYSDHLISDSVGIQSYLQEKYQKESIYIPYGAHLFEQQNISVLEKYGLPEYKYNMLIARLEPENNIETILDGVVESGNEAPFLVIGKHQTAYGEYLKNKYKSQGNIRFEGGIYDIEILNNLRHFSNLYFHGHTVGGTNPSLLEAMASQALIVAHDNVFNKSILGADAFYFNTADDIGTLINQVNKKECTQRIKNNNRKITETYAWPVIIDQYERHFREVLNLRRG